MGSENANEFELKSKICCTTIVIEPFEILTRYSDFNRLQRIIAYCRRFYHNLKYPNDRRTEYLTSEELKEAVESIVFSVQRETFSNDIKQLHKNQNLRRNRLNTLNLFIDKKDLLRVGGRLQHSNLTYDQKFPLVLPYLHHVTDIIVKNEHERLLHCGHEQLLAMLRLKYWILSGRRLVKKIIHKCIKCFKTNPVPVDHFMGNLPRKMVIASGRPFLNSGVDYAGPVLIRESHKRGRIPTRKAYIALFVCFATKAVHIELVTDLTADCFIAALKRFVGRRGLCNNLYSDNGTTFVGANNKLRELHRLLKNSKREICAYLSQKYIDWHFIPPRSPHFGGIWESNIKSMKRHLHRTIQNNILTYEELTTVLIGIESCLNSRPLTPCSSDPNDLNVLTPAHFVIGKTLLEPTEPDLSPTTTALRSRWQHLTRLRQQFWKRWNFEYLQQLQTRNKWFFKRENLKSGTLVLLMEENIPPLQWVTGRIEELQPGPDPCYVSANLQGGV